MIKIFAAYSDEATNYISSIGSASCAITGDKIEVRTGDDIPVMPVPRTLTSRQFWIAVDDAGLTDAVNAALDASPRRIKIEALQATEFVRDYPLLESMAKAIGKTPADIDALFVYGAML